MASDPEISSASSLLVSLKTRITRPLDALPIDIFRVLAGMLIFVYFARTFCEASDFSNPNGLIDHNLSFRMFWFTKIGLFQPWMSLTAFYAIYLFVCVLCISLVIGYRVKLSAVLIYLIAVSTYRWNFVVMYVDDSIIHLLLFWLVVLPTGRTLILKDWIRDRGTAWEKWKTVKVSGTVLRCFFWNLALLYIVAGLWKWTSPMWLDGTALYVIFKLPISYGHEFWGPQHLPALRILDYATLVLEPLFALMFILPRGHLVKYILLVGFIALHIGTVATLDIPFANFACAATIVLIFREELMDLIRGRKAQLAMPETNARIGFAGAAAMFMVTVLTLAMISSIVLPHWRTPAREQLPVGSQADSRYEGLGTTQFTFFGALWLMGLAQQYQLFNWIDDRNYIVRHKIVEHIDGQPDREIAPEKMFLPSTRGTLLEFYMSGITWHRVPPEYRAEFRESLITRIAGRYCRNEKPSGVTDVYSSRDRIDPNGGPTVSNFVPLMTFGCQKGDAVLAPQQ